MKLQALDLAAGVCAVLVLIGALGPWETLGGVLSIAGTESFNHGFFVILVSLAGAGLVMAAARAPRPSALHGFTLGAPVVGLLVLAYDWHHFRNAFTFVGGRFPIMGWQLGWGFYVALVGTLGLLAVGIGALVRSANSSVQTR